MKTMNESNRCPQCGAVAEATDLGGRCLRCMLELGIESSARPGDAEPSIASARTVARPSVIGRYRILELIGEGGMGSVYEAEQDHPRRTVALKIIKPSMANPELLRRFEQESQALGRLQHPGIAQIYEAGTVDTGFGPQPYFAMELIRGTSPREHAESHHLNTRERLAMMAKICDAVHHAHQRGLIHRDLKPANILVDASGQPKILDFGVARVTDSDSKTTQQTDLGQLIGTLAYMSPEQALADPLDIDTRSDVYALGVILYELLAGHLPYTITRNLAQSIQAIRQEGPAPLSTLNRTYRGDIETIVAKALEKDRERRYASAAGMAADIQRYLNHEPIVARPPTAIYQLQKFARRHRALVTGVTAVLLVLIVGVVLIAREAIRATAAEQMGLAQLARAESAEEHLRTEVENALNAKKAAVAAEEQATSGMLRAVAAEKRAIMAKDAAQAAQFAAQGKHQVAQALYARVLADDRLVFGNEDPITLSHIAALASLYVTPRLPPAEREYDRAEKLWKELLSTQRRTLGADAPGTMETMSSLASVYGLQGKPADAEALWARVVDGLSRSAGEESGLTLTSMMSLIEIYDAQGKTSQAASLESYVAEAAERLRERRDPLGQQILNVLFQEGTRPGGRVTNASTRNESTLVQVDNEGCSCTQGVILSETGNFDFERYLRLAMRPITDNWKAQIRALRRSDPSSGGKVVVRFYVSKTGVIEGLRLVSRSGAEGMDEAAASAVESASPFPRLPEDSKSDRIDMQISFTEISNLGLRGRVVVDSAANVAIPRFSLVVSGSSFAAGPVRMTAGVEPDGTFRVRVPAGEYRVSPSAIPSGFYVKTIVAGSENLLQSPIKLDGAEDFPEILITLGTSPSVRVAP